MSSMAEAIPLLPRTELPEPPSELTSETSATLLQTLLALQEDESHSAPEESVPPMISDMLNSVDWMFSGESAWDDHDELYDQKHLFPTATQDLDDATSETSKGSPTRKPATAKAPSKAAASDASQETNVYVSNLPRSITEGKFKALCVEHGPVFSTKLLHREAPMPTIGFAQYTTPEFAQAALLKMNGMMFQGRQLKVRLAHRDKDKGIANKPSANLYVSNLPKFFTETELRETFAPFGGIISLVVLRHPMTGQSKGIGLVRFSSVGEARRAKEALHGASLQQNTPLEVKYAENEKERSMRLARRQHAENEHIVPEALTLCEAIESYKKPLSHDRKPWLEDTPDMKVDPGLDDMDADSIFAALKQHAAVIIPMEGPKFEPPKELENEKCLYFDSGASDDTPVESPTDTGGNSIGNPESVSSESSVVAPVKEPRKLRAEAPPFVPKKLTPEPAAAAAEPETTTIKVENLPWGANPATLRKLCARHGDVKDVDVQRDAVSHTGVAFVQFANANDAHKARSMLDGAPLKNKQLLVSL